MAVQKDKIVKIGLLLLALVLIISAGILWVDRLYPPDVKEAEKLVDRGLSDFNCVIDFFVESGYKYIYIDREDCILGQMYIGGCTLNTEITDKAVLNTIRKLFYMRGYSTIGRNGDTVYFQEWSFNGRSRGVAFSLNESATPYVEFIIESEPLSVNDWYYYRADYEEYRNTLCI